MHVYVSVYARSPCETLPIRERGGQARAHQPQIPFSFSFNQTHLLLEVGHILVQHLRVRPVGCGVGGCGGHGACVCSCVGWDVGVLRSRSATDSSLGRARRRLLPWLPVRVCTCEGFQSIDGARKPAQATHMRQQPQTASSCESLAKPATLGASQRLPLLVDLRCPAQCQPARRPPLDVAASGGGGGRLGIEGCDGCVASLGAGAGSLGRGLGSIIIGGCRIRASVMAMCDVLTCAKIAGWPQHPPHTRSRPSWHH